jgi:hypothetical protein
MMKSLENLMHRVESWPKEAQHELVRLAGEIEGELTGEYQASPDELKAIDEALAQIERGEVASDAEVAMAFAQFRRG